MASGVSWLCGRCPTLLPFQSECIPLARCFFQDSFSFPIPIFPRQVSLVFSVTEQEQSRLTSFFLNYCFAPQIQRKWDQWKRLSVSLCLCLFLFIYSESLSFMFNSLQPMVYPWNYPGQGVFPTQGSNPGLPHCRWILSQLSHQGSPRILEWGAYPCSSGSSRPRSQTGVSCIAGGFFTDWAIREAPLIGQGHIKFKGNGL